MDKQNSSGDQRDLAHAFDAVPACLAFFDRQGNVTFANRAMTRLWVSAPNGQTLRQSVHEFARSIRHHICVEDAALGTRVLDLGVRRVQTAQGTYQLRGSYIGVDLFGCGGTVLISLEDVTPEFPSDEMLAQRFGLTAREVRVARLLAEGKSNAEIAADMYISPHTARTHTEHVLRKLNARSRAEVGPILRRG